MCEMWFVLYSTRRSMGIPLRPRFFGNNNNSMTSNEMERKIKRIVIDLEELLDERYINSDARKFLEQAKGIIEKTNIYSTELY